MPRRAWSSPVRPVKLLLLLAVWVGLGVVQGAEAVPRQILVKYRDSGRTGRVGRVGLQAADRSLLPAGAKRVRALPLAGWQLVEVSGATSARETLEWLRSRPEVEAAELNQRYRLHRVPDDPEYRRLYGMERIGAPAAWDLTQGDASVVVAVFDTGVDLAHPDLAPNLWRNAGEIAGNGVDDDGNGWIDDVHGADVVDGDGDPTDDAGHGTHVAGTIAAVGGNGLGVAGVAWRSKVLPVRVLSVDGSASTTEFVTAFDYVVRLKRRGAGVKVINCSWGGGFPSLALKEAMEAAAAEGMLIVCSAGNDHVDTDSLPTYPAGYDIPEIISVGASTSCDEPSSFSNYGRATVDIAAPGSGILSAFRGGDRYGVLSGTSMAAPHVSGAAALVFAVRPSAKPAEARAFLLGTVDPIPAWDGASVSGGRLNVGRAVERARNGRIPTLAAGPAEPSGLRVASRTVAGRWGNGRSFQPALSADGRWVAFVSAATNLVNGDREGYLDVFMHDRTTGAIQRVSQTPSGVGGAGDSESPAVSGDGRYVVFVSSAPNLVGNDINDTKDIFLWDRNSRQLELASLRSDGRASANGLSEVPAINHDGSVIVFGSDATDLVSGDGNQARDIFVRDRARRRTERANLGPGGAEAIDWSDAPTISGDGRYVAYHSGADNLVAGDTNTKWDVFVRDRVAGLTEMVGEAGVGNDDSLYPLFSADGNWITFSSAASSFAGTSTGGKLVQCLYERRTKSIVVAGRLPDGVLALADSFAFGITADGRSVTFTSDDPGLFPGGELGFFRTYLYDRLRDVYGPVALSDAGYFADDGSFYSPISADGGTVAYVSSAFSLVPEDGNAVADVFVVDRGTAIGDLGVRVAGRGVYEGLGTIHPNRPQRASAPVAAGASGDFEVILDNGGAPQGFRLDATGGRGGWRLRAAWLGNGVEEDITERLVGNGWMTPTIPAGGRLTFRFTVTAAADSVLEPLFASRIEVRSRNGGRASDAVALVATTGSRPPGWALVSRGDDGYPASRVADGISLSADGSRAAFSSEADHLDARGDSNLSADVFWVETGTGEVTRVSDVPAGGQGNGESRFPSMSADGRKIAFQSKADNLVTGDSNEVEDIFVKDMSSGAISRVSVSSSGAQGKRGSEGAHLAGDGGFIAFTSSAANLVDGDSNGSQDVFVRDLVAGLTECVSRSAAGAFGDADSMGGTISRDGRYVVFTSYAANLGPMDRNRTTDVYLWDRTSRTMELVSANASGAAGNGSSGGPSLSDDGRWVAFFSYATDLFPGGEAVERESYLLDRTNRKLHRVSEVVGALPDGWVVKGAMASPDGRWLGLSGARECGGGRVVSQTFAYDMVARRLEAVSVGKAGEWGDNHSFPVRFAADGRFLAFESMAKNLVGEPSYPVGQLFLADLARPGVEALARRSETGPWLGEGAGNVSSRPVAVVVASALPASGGGTSFSVRIRNEGNSPDRFRLEAEIPEGVVIRVDGAPGQPTVHGAFWTTPSVPPGATWDGSISIAFASPAGPDWDLGLRVESVSDRNRQDWIQVTAARDSDADGMPDSWETRYFGGLGVAGIGTDGDGDGTSDLAEWRTGSDPTRPGEALKLAIGRRETDGGVRLTWRGKSGTRYRVERVAITGGGFVTVSADPIDGVDGDMRWQENGEVGVGSGSGIYRLQVEER